ncbi:FKBP-type peptidyl-prolyl cis-trans isomerase [Algibacter lectus]|uniref:Peptidyl-prolyl cis-trans isomerase n=3 Tax=Algibacter lectus TaxID=221126 RepID=A0A4R8MDS8_9FLAO|nr:FKBP-type peptidyl-prolyl cis-trans isomerase [Algibacter lectus]MDO7137525.1 FKBP-type peptidyl-prolyl cis-trans isomerase [Algibacter lectus]MWW23971.1 FKBP-type peptidyl-prolyl cis-trans isomerase [Algibacter lectus]TDY61986.1 FKBP-type peptidyl-prolyl cis-trans isomerase FklB [Algibacter lectus]
MKTIKVLSLVALTALMASCNNTGVTKKPVKTELDSVSYAIGMDVARNVKTSFSEFDNELFIQGFMNAIDSTDILIDQAEAQKVVQAYFQKKQQADIAKQKEEAAKKAEAEFGEVKLAGEKFLEENKSKDGVQVTESGLQYIVEKEGTGEKPTTASQVKVHYHGTLTDGTIFDSSVDRGTPATFGVTQVIPGWTEGLQLMSVGSKYKFFVPQELGYGATPRGGKIKPFDVLVFDVELLEIVK